MVDDNETETQVALLDRPLDALCDEAELLKDRGNEQFSKGQYAVAITHYKDALVRLPSRREACDASFEGRVRDVRIKVQANLAAAHLKIEQYKDAAGAASEAIAEDPKHVKALHRRAVANEHLGGWINLQSALRDYQTLAQLESEGLVPLSFHAELHEALARLPPLCEAAGNKEKDEMLGQLKNVGDRVLGWFGLSTDNFALQQQEGGGYSVQFKS